MDTRHSHAGGLKIYQAASVSVKNFSNGASRGYGISTFDIPGSIKIVDSNFGLLGSQGITAIGGRHGGEFELPDSPEIHVGSNSFYHVGNDDVTQSTNQIRASAISVIGKFNSAFVRDNTINIVGYSGIWLKEGTDPYFGVDSNQDGDPDQNGVGRSSKILVENNEVRNYCFLLNDCGGFYTVGSTLPRSNSGYKVIRDNAFVDSWGNLEGVTKDRMSPAVYLDNGSSYWSVYNNDISRSRSTRGALWTNSGNYNNFYSNTIATLSGAAVWIARIGGCTFPDPALGTTRVFAKEEVDISQNRVWRNDFTGVSSGYNSITVNGGGIGGSYQSIAQDKWQPSLGDTNIHKNGNKKLVVINSGVL